METNSIIECNHETITIGCDYCYQQVGIYLKRCDEAKEVRLYKDEITYIIAALQYYSNCQLCDDPFRKDILTLLQNSIK